MSLFQYNTGIPAGPNNPSVDQPDMLTNTNSIDGLIDVDHIGFNENLGGYHDVIHQPPQDASPGTVAGIGQTYVLTVSGDQQLFYKSGLGVETQLSGSSGKIVAVVNFHINILTFAITIQNSSNITSVVRNSIGDYTITFTNALSSPFYYSSFSAQANCVITITGLPSTTEISILSRSLVSGNLLDPLVITGTFIL